MAPKIHGMRVEFKNVVYERFRNNFSRLKKGIQKHMERAELDESGYLHDISIYTLAKNTPGYWDGSKAQKSLRKDIKKGRHEKMKPEILRLSRCEYQEFSLKTFRGHIHQELRSERETNYWIVRKKKKQRNEEAKRKGEKIHDDDIDFLYDP